MAEILEVPKTVAVAVQGSTLKQLLQKRITKTIKFMGEDVLIRKLSINEIVRLQAAEEAQKGQEVPKDGGVKEGIEVTLRVVRAGWADAAEWTDEELRDLPFEELLTLAGEIMSYSGVATAKVGESK